jgi:hypothetical protein
MSDSLMAALARQREKMEHPNQAGSSSDGPLGQASVSPSSGSVVASPVSVVSSATLSSTPKVPPPVALKRVLTPSAVPTPPPAPPAPQVAPPAALKVALKVAFPPPPVAPQVAPPAPPVAPQVAPPVAPQVAPPAPQVAPQVAPPVRNINPLKFRNTPPDDSTPVPTVQVLKVSPQGPSQEDFDTLKAELAAANAANTILTMENLKQKQEIDQFVIDKKGYKESLKKISENNLLISSELEHLEEEFEDLKKTNADLRDENYKLQMAVEVSQGISVVTDNVKFNVINTLYSVLNSLDSTEFPFSDPDTALAPTPASAPVSSNGKPINVDKPQGKVTHGQGRNSECSDNRSLVAMSSNAPTFIPNGSDTVAVAAASNSAPAALASTGPRVSLTKPKQEKNFQKGAKEGEEASAPKISLMHPSVKSPLDEVSITKLKVQNFSICVRNIQPGLTNDLIKTLVTGVKGVKPFTIADQSTNHGKTQTFLNFNDESLRDATLAALNAKPVSYYLGEEKLRLEFSVLPTKVKKDDKSSAKVVANSVSGGTWYEE